MWTSVGPSYDRCPLNFAIKMLPWGSWYSGGDNTDVSGTFITNKRAYVTTLCKQVKIFRSRERHKSLLEMMITVHCEPVCKWHG